MASSAASKLEFILYKFGTAKVSSHIYTQAYEASLFKLSTYRKHNA